MPRPPRLTHVVIAPLGLSLLLLACVAPPAPAEPSPSATPATPASAPAAAAPAAAGAPVATQPAINPVFPPPPRLAISAAEMAATKVAADFPMTREAAVRAADTYLAKLPVMPAGWANWIFYYACPDDGTRLNPLSLDKHQCPKCNKTYTDERIVTAYRCVLQEQCEFASLALAWAYAWTGDDKYARPIMNYLLQLAAAYPSLTTIRDRHDRTGLFAPGGARRYAQVLDESVGAVRYSKAYDLTRNAPCWTDADRRIVENDFFRPTTQTLLRVNHDISNHQTWHNAGLISIASVLGDADLVRQVLTMRGGVLDQMQRSIGDDGLWYEGTMAYHNYALSPMMEIADATRRMGLEIHNHPRLRLMFLGPIRSMYPDGSFPVTNDSDPSSISNFAAAFEWAWRTYKDPAFAQAAAMGDAAKLTRLLGPGAKSDWPPRPGSDLLAAAGLAYLRAGTGSAQACAVLDVGPHGGGHGHFDKLNLMLFARGHEWLLDPGRLSYSHKEYKTWVKFTAAHNTVALGGRTQAPHTGKLIAFEPGAGGPADAKDAKGSYVIGVSDAGYPGATLRRTLYLNAMFLVDLFDVQTSEPTQIDWLAHASADALEAPAHAFEAPAQSAGADAPPLGDHDGYPHLTSVRKHAAAPDPQVWSFVRGKEKLPVWLLETKGQTHFSCMGIGYNVGQKTPTLVRRIQGDRARFITVYDLGGNGSKIISAKANPDQSGVRLEIKTLSAGETKPATWSIDVKEKAILVDVAQ